MGARLDEARLLPQRAPTSARRTFEGGDGTLQSSPKYYFVGQRADLLLWQSPTTPTYVPVHALRWRFGSACVVDRDPQALGTSDQGRAGSLPLRVCLDDRAPSIDTIAVSRRLGIGSQSLLAAQHLLSVLRSCSISSTCDRSGPKSGKTRAASARLQCAALLFGRGRRAVDRRNFRGPSASLNLVQVRNHEGTLAW
jgi:hypothetical protein